MIKTICAICSCVKCSHKNRQEIKIEEVKLICCGCQKDIKDYEICDNDCGTYICPHGCGECYMIGNKFRKGHNPKCGDD